LEKFEDAITDLKKSMKLSTWDLIPQVHLFEVLVDARYFNDAEEGEENNLCFVITYTKVFQFVYSTRYVVS